MLNNSKFKHEVLDVLEADINNTINAYLCMCCNTFFLIVDGGIIAAVCLIVMNSMIVATDEIGAS